jgi:methionine aminopeptidase
MPPGRLKPAPTVEGMVVTVEGMVVTVEGMVVTVEGMVVTSEGMAVIHFETAASASLRMPTAVSA